MSPKKHSKFHIDWKMLLTGGFITVFVTGGLFVYLRDQVGRVWAAPQRVDELEEQQQLLVQQSTTIGKWVESQERERQLKRSAPPGWMWSEIEEKYIVDPSYKAPR